MLSLKQCIYRSLWIYVCSILIGTAIAAFLESSSVQEVGTRLSFFPSFVSGLLIMGVCCLPILVVFIFVTKYVYNRYEGNISRYTVLQIGIVLLSFLFAFIYSIVFLPDEFFSAVLELLRKAVPYVIVAFLFTYGVHKYFDKALQQSRMNLNSAQDILDDNFMNN